MAGSGRKGLSEEFFCLADIAFDLADQAADRWECALAADFCNELSFEIFAVQVPVKTENMDLDDRLNAARIERRAGTDITYAFAACAVIENPHRIDARGRGHFVMRVDVRRGETEFTASAGTGHDVAVHAHRRTKQSPRGSQVACGYQTAYMRTADGGAVDLYRLENAHRDMTGFEQLRQQNRIAGRVSAETEILPYIYGAGVHTAADDILDERARAQAGKGPGERNDDTRIHAQMRKQPQPVLERIQDLLSAGMWPERDNDRASANAPRAAHARIDDEPVGPVHAVENADGQDRAAARADMPDVTDDVH